MRIVFCGVGALGPHAAVLCRNLAAELVFVDFDRVESKNLAAQWFMKPSIGKNKADALRLQLSNFFGVKSRAFGVRLTSDNASTVLEGAHLLVDAFDNIESRALLSNHARRTATPLVHAAITADGTFGLVRWDERFQPDPEDHANQATCEGREHLPFIAQTAAALARVIQDFTKTQVRRDVMISLAAVTPTS